VFYGTRRFITALTRARHLSLSKKGISKEEWLKKQERKACHEHEQLLKEFV
jgi:hypothetical protein